MKITSLLLLIFPILASAQSSDWTNVIWREPQVRYLLADMSIGGKTDLYRKYAKEEKDPDSSEAIRLYDLGVRVVNTNDFERKWVHSQYASSNRMFRVVFRGSDRTITGREALLSSDYAFNQADIRIALGKLTLGMPLTDLEKQKRDPSVAEALRHWGAGDKAINSHLFELKEKGDYKLVYQGTDKPVDGAAIRLHSDLPYPEVNVRYFMADMALGGSRDFYWRTAEIAHEMGCLEAVLRHDSQVKITNLDLFERKKVDGKVLITRKGSNERISGTEVKLSTDLTNK
jgi:hypothetical protein